MAFQDNTKWVFAVVSAVVFGLIGFVIGTKFVETEKLQEAKKAIVAESPQMTDGAKVEIQPSRQVSTDLNPAIAASYYQMLIAQDAPLPECQEVMKISKTKPSTEYCAAMMVGAMMIKLPLQGGNKLPLLEAQDRNLHNGDRTWSEWELNCRNHPPAFVQNPSQESVAEFCKAAVNGAVTFLVAYQSQQTPENKQ